MLSHETHDYVIVGGGTAGCVLANRLSADGITSVLLLEAGPEATNPYFQLPVGWSKLPTAPYQWGFKSVPQRQLNQREIPIVQARVIGGGGSLNAQIFTRGVAADYDEWSTRYGCDGWSFADIQRYFLRSEDNHCLSAPWHGVGGPLGVSDLVSPRPLSKAFVRAGEEYGLPFNGDFNGPTQYGVGLYQMTTRNARRCSTAVGYLRPARARAGVTVKSRVLALRILLEGRRAVGVEVIEEGRVRKYLAEREVIVTAGPIGSPKLLMLSGIGDPTDLKHVGIEPTVPLPGVGRNFHDHCEVDIGYELSGPHSFDRYKKKGWALLAGLEYVLFRKGPVTSSMVEAGAFSCADPTEKTPDLQFHFVPVGGDAGDATVRSGYGCTLNSYFLRPRSRGTVRLAAADPTVAPLIDPNYLADEHDLEMTAVGLMQSREMMSQSALARFIKAETFPGSQVRTKQDLIAYIRRRARTSYHLVGTCKMGRDDGAVVSPELKVWGVEGLRVCDSSVMPRIVSSNTQAATVMIAEKASDLILAGDRNRPFEALGTSAHGPGHPPSRAWS